MKECVVGIGFKNKKEHMEGVQKLFTYDECRLIIPAMGSLIHKMSPPDEIKEMILCILGKILRGMPDEQQAEEALKLKTHLGITLILDEGPVPEHLKPKTKVTKKVRKKKR